MLLGICIQKYTKTPFGVLEKDNKYLEQLTVLLLFSPFYIVAGDGHSFPSSLFFLFRKTSTTLVF